MLTDQEKGRLRGYRAQPMTTPIVRGMVLLIESGGQLLDNWTDTERAHVEAARAWSRSCGGGDLITKKDHT